MKEYNQAEVEKQTEPAEYTANIQLHPRPLGNLAIPEAKVAHQEMQQSAMENAYQSAGMLMRSLADTIVQWRKQLPEDQQPAILALLHGGAQIQVVRLAQESFHGIRIEGVINGSPCMLLAHQSTVQLMCYVEKVTEKADKRTIGFIIDGEEEKV